MPDKTKPIMLENYDQSTGPGPDPMNSPHSSDCTIWKWKNCSCGIGMDIEGIPPFTTDPIDLVNGPFTTDPPESKYKGPEGLEVDDYLRSNRIFAVPIQKMLIQFGELVRGKVIDSVAQSEHDDWEEYAEQLGGEINVDLHQLLKEFLGESSDT